MARLNWKVGVAAGAIAGLSVGGFALAADDGDRSDVATLELARSSTAPDRGDSVASPERSVASAASPASVASPASPASADSPDEPRRSAPPRAQSVSVDSPDSSPEVRRAPAPAPRPAPTPPPPPAPDSVDSWSAPSAASVDSPDSSG